MFIESYEKEQTIVSTHATIMLHLTQVPFLVLLKSLLGKREWAVILTKELDWASVFQSRRHLPTVSDIRPFSILVADSGGFLALLQHKERALVSAVGR